MTYVENVVDNKPCYYPWPEGHEHKEVLNLSQFNTTSTSEGRTIYLPFCRGCNELLAKIVRGIQLPSPPKLRRSTPRVIETAPDGVDEIGQLAEDELRALERAAEHILTTPGVKPPPLPSIAAQEANVAKVQQLPKALWPKSDPRQVNENVKRRNRAIRDGTYARLLEEQDNRCACCKAPFVVTPHLDHNHKTGTIRGLVCAECNLRYIALADKDPQRMLRAVQYVRKHRAKTA